MSSLARQGKQLSSEMDRAVGWNLWLCDTASRYTTNVWELVTVSPKLSSLADAQWLSLRNSPVIVIRQDLRPPRKCPAILSELNVLAEASSLTGETIRPRELLGVTLFWPGGDSCGQCVAILLPFLCGPSWSHLRWWVFSLTCRFWNFFQQYLSMDSWYSCEEDCNLNDLCCYLESIISHWCSCNLSVNILSEQT